MFWNTVLVSLKIYFDMAHKIEETVLKVYIPDLVAVMLDFCLLLFLEINVSLPPMLCSWVYDCRVISTGQLFHFMNKNTFS